jgi:predicted ATP-grasp superfamily ATP-dependent carboligase
MHGRATTVHPDLGHPLAGIPIPTWEELLLLATRAADAVELGMVGVDLVLDRSEGPLVLELNARPGLTIQVANRRGLRTILERIEAMTIPSAARDRVRLGRELG